MLIFAVGPVVTFELRVLAVGTVVRRLRHQPLQRLLARAPGPLHYRRSLRGPQLLSADAPARARRRPTDLPRAGSLPPARAASHLSSPSLLMRVRVSERTLQLKMMHMITMSNMLSGEALVDLQNRVAELNAAVSPREMHGPVLTSAGVRSLTSRFLSQNGRTYKTTHGHKPKPLNSNDDESFNEDAFFANHVELLSRAKKHIVHASFSLNPSSVMSVGHNMFCFADDNDFSATLRYAQDDNQTVIDDVVVIRYANRIPSTSGTVMPSISTHSWPEWTWFRPVKLVIHLENARALRIQKHTRGEHSEIVLLPGVLFLTKLKKYMNDEQVESYVAACVYRTPFHIAIGFIESYVHVGMALTADRAQEALRRMEGDAITKFLFAVTPSTSTNPQNVFAVEKEPPAVGEDMQRPPSKRRRTGINDIEKRALQGD